MDTTQYEEDFQKIVKTIQERGYCKLKPRKISYSIRFGMSFYITSAAFYSIFKGAKFGIPVFLIFGFLAIRDGSAFTGLRNHLLLTSEYMLRRGILFSKIIYWKDARFFHPDYISIYRTVIVEYFNPSDTHIEWTHQERITKFEIIDTYGMSATKLATLLTRLQIYYTRDAHVKS
jgi:hypothetical protein